VAVIAVVDNDQVLMVGTNDTSQEWSGEVRYRLLNLSGGMPVD